MEFSKMTNFLSALALASGDVAAAGHHDLFSTSGLFTMGSLVSLLVLTVLEVIFGVDNVLYMGMEINRLKDSAQRKRANSIGILLGAGIRIGLLILAAFAASEFKKTLFSFTDPFEHFEHDVNMSDLFLIVGGLFLVFQATRHLFQAVEAKGHGSEEGHEGARVSFGKVLVSICWINIIFSFDSVFTAVGTANSIYIMAIAIFISIAVMAVAAMPIAKFIEQHPSFNVLALAFLLVIGVHLTAEGLDYHMPKFLIYGMAAFAFVVDLMQFRQEKNLKKGTSH